MATTVDERIVAAKFDASDFEKGVDKTLKKLDELKKGLDFKEATKGVKELAEKTEVSTDSMSKSLEKLTERFTTFAGMIKQKILGGLADEVAGVFLRMEQGVTSFIRSIGSDQVSAGMAKYEQLLTSVRIMMSAGRTEEESYKSIERLQEYADETSYSLSQMTDAMSKMVAAGVKLDDATKNVEGIANACANAGINANDAQRAFFNLSQAFTSGKLQYTDYRSLELLNMTTEEFKRAMLESAEAAGTLKKIGNDMWQTINKNDKKVTAGKKVTLNNLSDMLRYNFMNTNALNQLFGNKYWMEVIGREELEKTKKEFKKLYGDNWEVELKKKYGDLAYTAFEAAREARSFTDVINALKDAVSTGWSNTFEHLFGKLTEAKDFFTDLSNSTLADVIYNIGTYRNALLGFWDEVDAAGNGSGGKVLRETILNLAEALGTLFHTFQQVLPGFDELEEDEEDGQGTLKKLGHQMFETSMKIRDFSIKIKLAAEEFNKFMNSPMFENGPTRIEMIRQIIANIGSTISIVAKLIRIALETVHKTFYTIYPVFDGILRVLEKITEPIKNLKDNEKVFKDVEYSVDNILTVLKPVAEVLGQIIGFLSEVAGFIAQMALDTLTANISFFADTLGFFMELFTKDSAQMKDGAGIINGIREDFEGIKEACTSGLNAVKEFFGALLGDLRELFGLTDEEEKKSDKENQNGGVFARLINFFDTNEFVQNAKKWVDQAVIDIGNFIKSIPERVMSLGANIYDTIRNLFFKDEEVESTADSKTKETKTVLTPLGEWLDGVIKSIKEFIKSIPQRIIDGIGTVTNWIDETIEYFFGNRTDSEHKRFENEGGKWVEKDNILVSRFEEFIYEMRLSVIQWFEDLPNKIQKAFQTVGDFFTKVYNALDEFMFGKKVKKTITNMDTGQDKSMVKRLSTRYKSGFSKWLDTMIREIKDFIKKIPEYIKAGLKGAGDIISSVIGALFGRPDEKSVNGKTIEDKIAQPLLDIDLNHIGNIIRDIGRELVNQFARIFTGVDDVYANMDWFGEKVSEGINWISEKVGIAGNWVLEKLGNFPSLIAKIFKGEDVKNEMKGPIGEALYKFGSTIGQFIAGIPSRVNEFITNTITEFGKIWDTLYEAITGQSKEAAEKTDETVAKAAYPNAMAGDPRFHVKSKWEEFVESLGKLISTAFSELPRWIAEGIHMALESIGGLLGTITEWLRGSNAAEEMQKAAKEASEQVGKGVENITDTTVATTEKEAEDAESPLLNTIKGIGQTLYNLITTTIPAFLKEAWIFVTSKASSAWDSIVGLFDNFKPEDFKDTVDSIGEQIKTAILGLPDTIANTFKTVADIVGKLLKGSDPFKMSKTVPESARATTQALLDTQRNIANGLKNNKGSVSIIDTFKSIFDSIFGEDGVLSGDIGEKILKFFTETIPNAIGKAIGAMINQIPKIYKSFSEGMLSVSKAEGKDTERRAEDEAETAAETTVRISNAFAGILESFMKGLDSGALQTTAVAIVKLIAIIEVLKVVRDIISTINVTKNLADRAEDANSFTSAMKRIATAIMVAFGLVAYLTTLDDKKRADAMEVIKDLTHMFELLATLTTVGSVVKDVKEGITDTVSSVADIKKIQAGEWEELNGLAQDTKQESSKFGKIGEAASSAVSSVLTATGLTMAGETIQYGLEDIIGSVVDVFERLANGLKTVSGYISETVGILLKIKTDIVSAIDVAGNAFTLVSKISELGQFKDTVETIEGFMPSLTGALSLFKNSVSGRWIRATEITESINSLINMIEPMKTFAEFTKDDLFEQFKYGLASIGAALSLYTLEGASSVSKETGIAAAVSVLKDILGNGELNGLAAQLNTDNFPDATSMYGASEKIVILAGAIASISKASSGIPEDAGDNLRKLFNAVNGIEVPTDQGAINDIAGKFGTLGNALGTFANDTSGLTEDKLKSVKIAIDIMMDLTQSLKGTGQSFIEKVFEGDEGLDEFGTKLSLFGTKLRQFFDAIDDGETTYNAENISTALLALRTLAVAYRDLNEKELLFKTDWSNLGSGLEDFAGTFSRFLGELKLVTLTDDQNTKIRRMLEMIHTLAETAVLGYGNNANTELGELANQINPNNTTGIGNAMFTFYNMLTSLEVDENAVSIFESFATTLNAIGSIAAKGLSARSGGIAYGRKIFDDITTAFTAFNTNFDDMKAFFVNVKEFDKEGVETAKDLFESLYNFGGALAYFSDVNVDRGLNNMKWFDWGNLIDILSNNFMSMIDNNKEKIEPIGEQMAAVLFAGIQKAFNDPTQNLQPHITPVLEMGVMEQQMKDFFGIESMESLSLSDMVRSVMGANSQTEEDRIRASELYARLANLGTDIRSITSNVATVGDVTAAFAGMKIITDTGVLAGELTDAIDERIGYKIWLIEQGIAPA